MKNIFITSFDALSIKKIFYSYLNYLNKNSYLEKIIFNLGVKINDFIDILSAMNVLPENKQLVTNSFDWENLKQNLDVKLIFQIELITCIFIYEIWFLFVSNITNDFQQWYENKYAKYINLNYEEKSFLNLTKLLNYFKKYINSCEQSLEIDNIINVINVNNFFNWISTFIFKKNIFMYFNLTNYVDYFQKINKCIKENSLNDIFFINLAKIFSLNNLNDLLIDDIENEIDLNKSLINKIIL